MDNQDFKIDFVGLEPEAEVRNFLQEFSDRLRLQSPCDSCFRVAIVKTKRALRTSCRIVSRAGTFVARAYGNCPQKSLKYLERRLVRQLNKWKRNRSFHSLMN